MLKWEKLEILRSGKSIKLNDVSFFKAWNVGCTSGQHVPFFPSTPQRVKFHCVQLTGAWNWKFVSELHCVTCASTELCSEIRFVLQTKIELMSPIESYCQLVYETIKLQIIVFYETTNHCFLWNYKSLFSIYWKSTLGCMESPLCFGFSGLGLDRNIS